MSSLLCSKSSLLSWIPFVIYHTVAYSSINFLSSNKVKIIGYSASGQGGGVKRMSREFSKSDSVAPPNSRELSLPHPGATSPNFT